MKGWRISRRAMVVQQLLDLPFVAVVTFGVASALGLEAGAAAGPWLSLSVLRGIVLFVVITRQLGPVDRWESASGEARTGALAAANRALARGPLRCAIAYGVGWALSLSLSAAWIWFVHPVDAPIGLADVLALEFLAFASLFGALTFGAPVLDIVVRETREKVSLELAELGLESQVPGKALAHRLALYMSSFVLTAATLIAAPSWANHVSFERYRDIVELNQAFEDEARALAAGEALTQAKVVEEAPPAQAASAAKDQLPPLGPGLRVQLDRRAGRASLARALDEDGWLVLERELSGNDDGYVGLLLIFVTVILLWAPLTIVLLIRSLVAPLREVEVFLSRVTTVGDLSALTHLPVIQHDEIGILTQGVNALVLRLQALATAALAVSRGELGVEIEAHGELGEAFLAMVMQLDEMVTQIRMTAVEVGSVSAEIYAAAQRQEDAAGDSATTVREVSATVRSLADAAERITGRADEVLGAAERGTQTADAMVGRIDALTALASGISDLVERIRDIADRSDLLALNGSLEATRAGEAGRGFALVAAEMRRLAERVTATVIDVRGRIARIEGSGASAKEASTAAREINTQTASVAEEIALLTRRQRDETEVASQAIESMAEFVTAASVSTSQTRAAAEGLRNRVMELERLVRQFNTRER